MDYSGRIINFPRQKLSDSKKTEAWFKQCVDFAENILVNGQELRNSYNNKKVNLDLRANIIDHAEFESIINPDNLDLKSLPATFQHIGIENTKIDLLLGEYSKRKHSAKAIISSNDSEGISRKDKELTKILNRKVAELIKRKGITEEEIKTELEALQRYATYDFQDIAEITANKVLKYEFKKQKLNYLYEATYESLITTGEQIVYCGVLGGRPVMRKVNPLNFFTLGGSTMKLEDADIMMEAEYRSIGQVIDDYWDVLTPTQSEYLEKGYSANTKGPASLATNGINLIDMLDNKSGVEIFAPSAFSISAFGGKYNANGEILVLKVCWRSRRKIGKRKFYDEDGEAQFDYVDENYTIDKINGEEVSWRWVNEWLEATKIGDIYVNMRVMPNASKSTVNKSAGTPNYIGTVNSINGYPVQSLTDVMKPLTYSYDVAYYKRELEIATYKGNFAAINASMVPAGWEPKEWIRYITINKFGFLDPTNEILKGPSQGKSAGAFNTLTAANVQIGDPQAIAMYTNILLDIENTLGKIAGVTGAREGQIQSREAVGNVEREVAQTSHITEKWFSLDAHFRERSLTKFLDVCKGAYKENPMLGQYILDDLGVEMIQLFDEFSTTEMDVIVSNASDDAMLYNEIKGLSQAAIQNGQAKIGDLVAIAKAESVQELARKLEDSSKRIQQEQQQAAQQQQEAVAQMKQQEMQSKQAVIENDNMNKEKDRELKYAELALKEREIQLGHVRDQYGAQEDMDTDDNGIKDEIDMKRLSNDELYKKETLRLKDKQLNETIRNNKAKLKVSNTA